MKKIVRSRTLVTTLILTLLCSVIGPFVVKAPASTWVSIMPSQIDSASVPILLGDTPYVPPDLLKNEADKMQRFAAALIEYQKQFVAVTKSTKPDGKQIAELQAKLKDLRSQFPQFQNNVQEVISKLKSAQKWTTELDSYFEKTAKSKNLAAQFLEFVRQENGARKFLEKSLTELNKLPAEFDHDAKVLNDLSNTKVSWLNWTKSFVAPGTNAIAEGYGCGHCVALAAATVACVFGGVFGCPAGRVAQEFADHCVSACRD